MCRNNQPHYQPNKDIDQQLEARPVKCNEAACSFNSPLKVFLMHSHGRQKYVNNRNDLESLRPARPPGARMIVFAGTGQTGERVTQLRDQLTQVKCASILNEYKHVICHLYYAKQGLKSFLDQRSLLKLQISKHYDSHVYSNCIFCHSPVYVKCCISMFFSL